MFEVQQIAFILLNQLDKVLQRHRVLELQSGGRVVCPLGHVSLLDNVGRFRAEQFYGRLIVCDAIGNVDQAPIEATNFRRNIVQLTGRGPGNVRAEGLLLFDVFFELLYGVDDFLGNLELLRLGAVRLPFHGFRSRCVDVNSA